MLSGLEYWRALTPRARTISWLACVCTLVALSGWCFLLGPYQARIVGEAQVQRQQSTLAVQRRQIWLRQQALPRDPALQTEATAPFSPLNLPSADAQLVSWKPDEKGGELVLEAHWSAFPEMFMQLAEQEMTPAAFTIAPEGSVLRFTLHLEQASEG